MAGAGSAIGGAASLRVEHGDQGFLPGLALNLPSAEPDKNDKCDQRRDQHPDPGTPRPLRHTQGAAHGVPGPSKRDSAALWKYCSEIIIPFIGRNGPSVTIRIKGTHSAACTQYGG